MCLPSEYFSYLLLLVNKTDTIVHPKTLHEELITPLARMSCINPWMLLHGQLFFFLIENIADCFHLILVICSRWILAHKKLHFSINVCYDKLWSLHEDINYVFILFINLLR
ncbi:hypothetical protein POPTR_019G005913v4 [Populus trichocarpa]|uniref:Uncharacterized protein n=1 Tax=Populus trichocarpa TaxID=3694 RepID=A0ACC0RIU4_POPTR|nr:hypothetical protein POPTR_019G005913v4 [Populus trichocarpa]